MPPVARAARLVAIATALGFVHTVVDLFSGSTTGDQYHLVALLAQAAMVFFFWATFRNFSGRTSPLPLSSAASILLVLGFLLPVLYTIYSGGTVLPHNGLTVARTALAWGVRFAWTVFLILFALDPSDLRIVPIAKGLALLTALELPSALLALAQARPDLFWNDHLVRAFWRLIARPINIFTISVQVLFFWNMAFRPPGSTGVAGRDS